MKPLDPRLLRFARSSRRFLAWTAVLGVVTAVLVILQARLLSQVIVDVESGGADWSTVVGGVVAIGLIFAARAGVCWVTEVVAVKSSARAKAELRESTLAHVLRIGPYAAGVKDHGAAAALITRGIDGLDAYFSRYLPQLALSVVVPLAVLLTILSQDVLSAVIVAVTIPLIPLFMIVIGLYTRTKVDRQWRTLSALSGHFLDLIAGLPTLRVFGRSKSQIASITLTGEEYRSTTMGVLRISFLSALVLELLAMLSVALVAVSAGVRLAEGQLAFGVALFLLLLAPEAYMPLRLVGQHFHAAAEGLGAAERLFAILESPAPVSGGIAPPFGQLTIEVNSLSVAYPMRDERALESVTFTATPGTVTAIVGRSGGGKSTLLAALLGFLTPRDGDINVIGASGERIGLAGLDLEQFRARIGWLPQRANLVTGDLQEQPTIRQIVRVGAQDAGDDVVWRALTQARVADIVLELAGGLDARLSADGSGLSMGQLQRIALARAIVGEPDIVLLDEPTAALDVETEAAAVTSIRGLADRGATVLVVTHRPAVLAICDQVLHIDRAGVAPVAPDTLDAADVELGAVGW